MASIQPGYRQELTFRLCYLRRLALVPSCAFSHIGPVKSRTALIALASRIRCQPLLVRASALTSDQQPVAKLKTDEVSEVSSEPMGFLTYKSEGEKLLPLDRVKEEIQSRLVGAAEDQSCNRRADGRLEACAERRLLSRGK